MFYEISTKSQTRLVSKVLKLTRVYDNAYPIFSDVIYSNFAHIHISNIKIVNVHGNFKGLLLYPSIIIAVVTT